MDGHTKRKRSTGNDLSNGINAADQDDLARTYQTLPVASLPPDFDGVPLDGAQYLAIVRQESSTVPAVSYAVNPFAKPDVNGQLINHDSSWNKDSDASAAMPSIKWRKRFLSRFSNMRNTLANRCAVSSSSNVEVPRGKSAKLWYRFLHGRDIQDEIEYDDEQDEDGEMDNNTEALHTECKEPSEVLLHCFSSTQIIILLSLIPYWLTQPRMNAQFDEDEDRSAIDPFHSRWIFSLLAHLDEHLIGDDISVLRILARACLACIVKSRIEKKAKRIKDGDTEDDLHDEMGAWMIICAIAGIWGQHDIWDDSHRDLLLYAS